MKRRIMSSVNRLLFVLFLLAIAGFTAFVVYAIEGGKFIIGQAEAHKLGIVLPKYNAKCVNILETALNGTTDINNFNQVVDCANQLKDKNFLIPSSDVQIIDGKFKFTDQLTEIVKGHQQASQNLSVQLIGDKLKVLPLKKTISELKPK